MKKVTIGILLGIMITAISSYTTTNNRESYVYSQRVIIPLKQKNIVITGNYKKMKSMVRNGYILEDVDFIATNVSPYRSNVTKYYTLIKY